MKLVNKNSMALKHRPTSAMLNLSVRLNRLRGRAGKIPTRGALFLGGHSVGATIALEMSQQLIARGREVSLLVIFDGWLLNTGAEISFLNPLYWFNLLRYLPRWINEVLMVKYSFQGACRMLVEKFSSRHAVESVVNLTGC